MRSLYLPPIIFWNAATGHSQPAADPDFGIALTLVSPSPAKYAWLPKSLHYQFCPYLHVCSCWGHIDKSETLAAPPQERLA
jgi:hypothetical protein